jgi:hypothetical protein
MNITRPMLYFFFQQTIISHPEHPLSAYSQYVNSWLSQCSGPYCEYPQSQVTNLASNFVQFTTSIADPSVGDQDYTDDTCMVSKRKNC